MTGSCAVPLRDETTTVSVVEAGGVQEGGQADTEVLGLSGGARKVQTQQ